MRIYQLQNFLLIACAVFATLQANGDEPDVTILSTDYLNQSIEGARRLSLLQNGELGGNSKAKLILEPNACQLNQFGDTVICTLIAPKLVECELKALKLADPLGNNRVAYEIVPIRERFKGRLLVISAVENKTPFRLVYDVGKAERRVETLYLTSPDTSLLHGAVPILGMEAKSNGNTIISGQSLGGTSLSATSPNAFVNHEQVLSVDSVTGHRDEGTAHVVAKGMVNTTGWSNAQLSPLVYVVPPQDGIYEYMFVAEKPGGMSGQVLSPIETKETAIDILRNMRGMKVLAAQNEFTLRFLQFKETYPEPVDWYRIAEASTSKGRLDLEVKYAGGCAKHDFELAWDGSYLLSNPPVAVMRLIHDGNEDPCDALPTEELHFLLPQLQPCIIRLEDGQGSSRDIPYEIRN